jgi:tRNA modification GTPase
VLRSILELALAQGARLARPGEFTLRAFLSGRLDLTQAEAVLEVIQARTRAGLKVAEAHLQGGVGRRLREVRQDLLDFLARVEASLDFPEETPEFPAHSLAPALDSPLAVLQKLSASYREGRLLREGLLVVLAGRPNVGKSSLLNALLQMERAIVTEMPGTTRDLIEEAVTLGGVPVRLTDTAGLGPAQDRAEALGIARARERLAQADLVLYLVDGSRPPAPEDRQALQELHGRPGLAVINKVDLPLRLTPAELAEVTDLPVAMLSALTGQGVEELKQRIVDLALGGGLQPSGEIITLARHRQHLEHCLTALHQARALLTATTPWELVALELHEAIRALGEITGEEVGEDVLDRIFGEFCLGK